MPVKCASPRAIHAAVHTCSQPAKGRSAWLWPVKRADFARGSFQKEGRQRRLKGRPKGRSSAGSLPPLSFMSSAFGDVSGKEKGRLQLPGPFYVQLIRRTKTYPKREIISASLLNQGWKWWLSGILFSQDQSRPLKKQSKPVIHSQDQLTHSRN